MPSFSQSGGPLLILAGSLCFCTTGFAQAIAPAGATPPVVGCVRMLLGGLCLLIWCAFNRRLPTKVGWPLMNLAVSILAVLGFQLCFFKGVLSAGVAVGTVVSIGTTPIATALLAWIFLGERPARPWYFATILAVAGLCLINNIGAGPVNFGALLLPLGAGVFFAFFIVFSKALTERHAPDTVMSVVSLTVGLLMTPFLFFFPVDWLCTPRGALVALHLGAITAAMAFSLSLAGFRSTNASTASTISLAEPLGAACLGIFALREPLTPTVLCGIALMFAGVLLLIFMPGHASLPEQKKS